MAASDALQAPESQPAYSYIGTKRCKSCHLKVHKSWAKTKMGEAFETLKPGHAREAKQEFNLDVNKDYTTDTKCFKCHTTGYGKPGGYAVPDPKDRKAARKAKTLEGVGCESCHGPGSEYVKIFEAIDKSQRRYTVEELYSAGLRKPDKATCVACHNDEGPTVRPDEPFDYDKAMEEEKTKSKADTQIHMHNPLKLREG
jgi:hypothetical protein